MSRPAHRLLTCLRLTRLGPGLLALGLAVASVGCADDASGAGSVDAAGLRKAVADRRSHTFNLGRKTGKVSNTRLQAKGKPGQPIKSSVKTPMKTR